MVDFTSGLFLDHRHPPAALWPWASLTSGRPAAVEENEMAVRLAARVARRQLGEAGVVHRSAFHALWDVVDLVTRRGRPVLALDEAVYPVARWAAAGAAMRGVPVVTFRHRDAAALDDLVGRGRRAPIILTDGWCPDCSQPAPLARLVEVAAIHHGQLIVDDTMSVGVLGADPTLDRPFGFGGGGTFAWLRVERGDALIVASLAKAYGAPLAVTSGPESLVRRLRTHDTRWHSSPPSAADLAAGDAATADEKVNDGRRERLALLVSRLRRGLQAIGMEVSGRAFPLVTVPLPSRERALALYRRLAASGVHALVRQLRCGGDHSVTFVVTAGHRLSDIERVFAALAVAPRAATPTVAT